MKSINYKSGTALCIVCVLSILFGLSANAFAQEETEDDGWGAVGEPYVEPPAKMYRKDFAREKKGPNGTTVYEICVENVSDDLLVLSNIVLIKIKSGDVTLNTKDFKITPAIKDGAMKVAPGTIVPFISITSDKEIEDINFLHDYNYSVHDDTIQDPSKPTEGIDYAVFSKVDTVKKRVDYFVHNFTDRPLIYSYVQEFSDDDIGGQWNRNAVGHSMDVETKMTRKEKKYFKFKTKYSGPKKPTVVAAGDYKLIWRDIYLRYDDYPFINPVIEDIEFSTAKK